MAAGLGPWLLALALGLAGVWAQQRLMESGGGLRASGQSVQLSCRGYGFSFESYIVQWYRQAPGGRIKWLSTFVTSSDITFSHEVEGRATASQDDSQSLSFLSLRDLFPQDTAHYFCAVRTGTGNLAEL